MWLSEYIAKLAGGKKQQQFIAWALLGFIAFVVMRGEG
jgi:hypothetical protein